MNFTHFTKKSDEHVMVTTLNIIIDLLLFHRFPVVLIKTIQDENRYVHI